MLISILVPHKLRSRVPMPDGSTKEFFPDLVRSINGTLPWCNANGVRLELIVATWDDSDYPFGEWLDDTAEFAYVVVDGEGPFNRGKALNLAAKYASGDAFFLCDTDMLVSDKLWKLGVPAIRQGAALFPICYSEAGEGDEWRPKVGTPRGPCFVRNTGYGMAFVRRDVFNAVGGVPEYKQWGKEDEDFYRRVRREVKIVRRAVPGFYHQWHPTSSEFKNRHIC